MSGHVKSTPQKSRAKIRDMSPCMVFAHTVIAEVFSELGERWIITSVNDGVHSDTSDHYNGDAIDYRTWHLRPKIRDLMLERVRERLGPDFYVLLEAKTIDGNDRWAEHMHVGHRPRRD